MKNLIRFIPLLAGASLILPSPTLAANVSLISSDPINTSSFNSAGKWSDGQAPNAANDYFTAGYFMRTPADSGGGNSFTFAGHSLTLQQPTISGVRSIIVKSANNDTFTINNFTNAFGGILENGGSGNVVETFTGNLWTIAGNSAVMANQGSLIIGFPLAGADGVILTNGGGNASGITYNADNSAFKGKFYLSTVNFGNGGGATRVILNAANGAPGNPSTFTPDQFRLEAGCTLQDNAGITFNNANGGFTLLGNAGISAAATTVIAEPITDNGGSFSLTSSGTGTLKLSSANNTYSGGTVIASGVLQLGVAGALPVGVVSNNGTLDLNTFNATIDGLSGSGTVDTYAGGTPTLTVGANGGSGTFNGTVANSLGTVSLTKTGAGTQTLAGGYSYSGTTLVSGGTLNVLTALGVVPSAPGDLLISNGAVLGVDASTGVPLPANNIVVGANSTLNLTPSSTANAINANGSLTLQDNATCSINYGTLSATPTIIPLNVAGGISAPGTNIVIKISGLGFTAPSTTTLIKYTGAPLASIANFSLTLTPGIVATLVNNTANDSIDLNITSVSKQLSWYGANGNSWDLATVNWKSGGADAVYQQYTNGSVIFGDSVLFDDTLYNDFVNPQPTNINVTGTFSPYPFVVNSTLPYSLSGAGGITGPTSLVKSNTGSLTLLTANSFTGGVFVNGGSLVINNDSALGASAGPVALNGGTLQINGNTTIARPISIPAASSIGVAASVTAQLNGNIASSAGLTKIDNGTLALTGINAVNGALFVNAGTLSISGGTSTFTGNPSYVAYQTGSGALSLSAGSTLISTGELRVGGSDQNGPTYDATGTVTMSGGNAYLSALTIARGNNNQNTCSGEVDISGGTMTSTNDVLIGFAGTGKGTLRISGTGTLNVGTTVTKWLRFGQWDTTSGEIDITGGNLNLNTGTSIKFNQNNSSGPKTFTQDGGAVTFYSDFATNVGGGGNLDLMLTGTAAATNTYNLNGGTLTVPQVTSSGSSGTRIFNFNGGTLRPTASSATFFNLGTGNAVANVRNGGAIIDDGGFNITIAQPLVHSTISGDNATDGGLTKNGTGSLNLSGANTYNGNTTVNAGSLLMTMASALQGSLMISNNATLSVAQVGSSTKNTGNLTFNGGPAAPGATLGLALTASNDPSVPLLNCQTLTLNGTNTISLAGSVKVGTIALIKALGPIVGSGNVTNLILPQGAVGSVSTSFDGTYTTVSAVITSTGPGLVWTGGTNNLWDINVSTNWLLNSTATTYQQTIIPGDSVTFNDSGSGTVIVNPTVGPAALVISNNATSYTFSGRGAVAGPTGLLKEGSGTATLNLTNNTYTGDTTVNGGTLQVGTASAIPGSGSLMVGSGGTFELSGFSLTAKELTGSGVVDNNSGANPILTIGSSSGGTWNGTIQDHGAGGVALQKVGSGTWVIGGTNNLTDGQSFTDRNRVNQGTVIVTNGGLVNIPYLELRIADGASQTGAVVVAGGTLSVTNNPISVGINDPTANGTLIVNSGTIIAGTGSESGSFAGSPNNIVVGANGATGTFIVNGGQVLNNYDLWLGQNAGANATFYLNGGLVQARSVANNGTPASSFAYFNGGTLRAATNSADFLPGITANVMGNGLVLDDGGFSVSIATTSLTPGDGNNGGLLKQGAGTVYLDAVNTYTGTTLVTNGTLAGIGSITGPVVVAPAGNLGAGDAGTTVGSPLTINNSLTLQGAATFRISNDSGVPTSDLIMGLTSVNYGGTLVITNVTADGTALTSGETFQLFNATSSGGNFANIVGSPGSGLAYSFNPASGALSVVTSTLASNPTNITWSVSGNTLSLSWPADHQGWILQSQTNSLSAGLSSNWTDIPGSASVTNETLTIDPANPSVFYRLRHP